jgi:hypothetical protein
MFMLLGSMKPLISNLSMVNKLRLALASDICFILLLTKSSRSILLESDVDG